MPAHGWRGCLALGALWGTLQPRQAEALARENFSNEPSFPLPGRARRLPARKPRTDDTRSHTPITAVDMEEKRSPLHAENVIAWRISQAVKKKIFKGLSVTCLAESSTGHETGLSQATNQTLSQSRLPKTSTCRAVMWRFVVDCILDILAELKQPTTTNIEEKENRLIQVTISSKNTKSWLCTLREKNHALGSSLCPDHLAWNLRLLSAYLTKN